jgi:transcriptional regulator GlxA family with amidase domain
LPQGCVEAQGIKRVGGTGESRRDETRSDLSSASSKTLCSLRWKQRRSFDRNYLDVMGQTPAKAVERIRVEAAARSLERGDVSIKRIAATCGFGSDEHLRRAFVRQLEVTPDQYRAAFGGRAINDQAA